MRQKGNSTKSVGNETLTFKKKKKSEQWKRPDAFMKGRGRRKTDSAECSGKREEIRRSRFIKKGGDKFGERRQEA